jgi:hypothetical protein
MKIENQLKGNLSFQQKHKPNASSIQNMNRSTFWGQNNATLPNFGSCGHTSGTYLLILGLKESVGRTSALIS